MNEKMPEMEDGDKMEIGLRSKGGVRRAVGATGVVQGEGKFGLTKDADVQVVVPIYAKISGV